MFPILITDHKNTIASIKYNCKKNKISLFMDRRNIISRKVITQELSMEIMHCGQQADIL